MKQRLKQFYQEKAVPQLRDSFQYKNVHQVPYVQKIVVNRGLNEKTQNTNMLKSSLSELILITSQRRVATRARKSIAGFNIREKMPIGLIVTLRGERIYAFLDRLINLALPRIRDFQGVSPKSFDGQGNYNLGVKDQLIFPEIRYDRIEYMCGIDLSIVISTENDHESLALLKIMGIPFQKSHICYAIFTSKL